MQTRIKRGEPGYVDPRTGRTIPAHIRIKMGRKTRTLAERYWEKVDKRGPDECWDWLGNKNPHGYGQIYPGPDRATRRAQTMFAHHVATEMAGIDVPPGMVRDHLCRNRGCQNPAHLRIVPKATNSRENSSSPHALNAAKTHCVRGHELSGDNIIWQRRTVKGKNGKPKVETSRMCIVCRPFMVNSKLRIEAPK